MGLTVDFEEEAIRLRPNKSEVYRLWASNTKAQNIAGWVPEYGGIEGFRRGLSETIKWFKDPQNRSYYKSNIYNI